MNTKSRGTIVSSPSGSKACVVSSEQDYNDVFTGSVIKVGSETRVVISRSHDTVYKFTLDEVASFSEQIFEFMIPSVSITDMEGVLTGFYNSKGTYKTDGYKRFVGTMLSEQVDNTGIIRTPLTSSTMAYMTLKQSIPVSTKTILRLDAVSYDQATEFNMSTFEFIPRVDGIYQIEVNVAWDSTAWGASDNYVVELSYGGKTKLYYHYINSVKTGFVTGDSTITVRLAAWDKCFASISLFSTGAKNLLEGLGGTIISYTKVA